MAHDPLVVALEPWHYNFAAGLKDIGVLGVLPKGSGSRGLDAQIAWKIRREWFSDFVEKLSGVGWNTFDYVLRDLSYPGSVLLFKLDSTNEAFMKAIGMPVNRDRAKYIDALGSIGILDEYPIAVVNMAIYAFSSLNCLGYLKRLNKAHGGFELV